MRLMKKIFIILIVSMCILIIMPKSVSKAYDLGDVVNQMTAERPNVEDTSDLSETVGKVLSFLQVISALISVLVIATTGFQYIVAGTPEMKKELGNKMLPIVVGAICVFGAVSIAKFVLAIGGE